MKKFFISFVSFLCLQLSGCGSLLILAVTELGQQQTEKLETGCNNGAGNYCFQLGDSYYNIMEYTKAQPYYEKACKLNDKDGCSSLGYFYESGLGVSRDDIGQAKFFMKNHAI